MDLIKENKFKKRAVFFDGEFYYKTWYFKDLTWLKEHTRLLEIYAPEIVDSYTFTDYTMTLKMNIIEGKIASECSHTFDFIDKIYKACIKNIDQTSPYLHGDWVLSNIVVSPTNDIKFIDWDNLSLHPRHSAIEKLHSDLESSFGEKFKRYLNDTAGI